MGPTPNGNFKRGPWSPTEDQWLLALVEEKGAQNWVNISNILGTRSPKQCRERYHQNLKPSLNKEQISPEEGQTIELLVNEMGRRWADIARRLEGRSDNSVKNWWNGGVNRRKRAEERRTSGSYEELSCGDSRPTKRRRSNGSAMAAGVGQMVSPDAYPHKRPHLATQSSLLEHSRRWEEVTDNSRHRMEAMGESHNPSEPLHHSATTFSYGSYTQSRPQQRIMIPDSHTRVDYPLISPPVGTNPPSLIDDSGSQMSPSPRLVNPPNITGHTPVVTRQESREFYFTGISPVVNTSPIERLPAIKLPTDSNAHVPGHGLHQLAAIATTIAPTPDVLRAAVYAPRSLAHPSAHPPAHLPAQASIQPSAPGATQVSAYSITPARTSRYEQDIQEQRIRQRDNRAAFLDRQQQRRDLEFPQPIQHPSIRERRPQLQQQQSDLRIHPDLRVLPSSRSVPPTPSSTVEPSPRNLKMDLHFLTG